VDFWTRLARPITGLLRKFALGGFIASGTPSRVRILRLVRAAEQKQVELIVMDNRYQPKIALRTADHLIREQVDLVIEFQTDQTIAAAIASKYLDANIPFIAIDIISAVGREETGTARWMKSY
jgi:ribose transport system substrate-binding protein